MGATALQLLLVASLAGCGGESTQRADVVAPIEAVSSPPPPDVRFLVNLPAVVLWGAEQRSRQPDASEELKEYRRLAPGWTTADYLDCRWASEDLDDFRRCAEPHIPEEHRALVESVMNDVVKDLRPTWVHTRASLLWLQVVLTDFLEREDARQMLEEVRAFSGSTVFNEPIRVPLVPHGLAGEEAWPHVWGLAWTDRIVLVEIPGLPVTHYFSTFLHELVHIGNARSGGRGPLENALVPFGSVGVVAATRWNEATAQAFEQRGSRRFNLSAYEGIPYNDASVQGIADRLFEQMEEGPLPQLGTALAQPLVNATRVARPAASWVITDFSWRLVVFSDSRLATEALGDSMRLLRDVHHVSLGEEVAVFPVHHGALVLATADELATHDALVQDLRAEPLDVQPAAGEVKTQVTRLPNGAIAILIVGQSEAELVAGSRYVAAHHDEMLLPPPGWHTMIAAPE